MKGSIPIETQKIFETLTKGHFISGDSENQEIKSLFNVIEEENNYEILLDYFSHIDYQLIKGNSYYYFSKKGTNKQLEDKLKSAYKWIDIIDFFMTFGESVNEYFSVGKMFTTDDIFIQWKVNNALAEKLNNIKLVKNIDKPREKIKKLIDELIKATFVEIFNEFHDKYKVLASFDYLEQLIKTIDITIDDEDTTFE